MSNTAESKEESYKVLIVFSQKEGIHDVMRTLSRNSRKNRNQILEEPVV